MKLGIREGMAPGATLADKLAWIESVRLDGIELHGDSLALPREELLSVLASSPIAVSAIEGIPRLIDPDPAVRSEAMRLTRERLRLAAEVKATGVLVVPQFGRAAALPDLRPWKSGAELERALLVQQLKELAPEARDLGVAIFTEPLNRYEAYIVNSVKDGAALAKEVGPTLGTMADFFHMNIEEANIVESLRSASDHIDYVHVADSNRAQPGMGHTDFRPGFAALKNIGYDGWLALECTKVIGEYDKALRDAASLVRDLWESA